MIAFADRNENLWGTTHFGIPVIAPSEILKTDYERVVISSVKTKEIIHSLVNTYGVPEERIEATAARASYMAREMFLRNFARMADERGIMADVAEGGVFQGDFAAIINESFPNSRLYLFDTFEGFSDKDTETDAVYAQERARRGLDYGFLKDTSVDLVMSKLPYPDNAVVRKGYFPESAEGVDDSFVFVNLDFDLYAPIKAGLEFFYPKLVRGGVILVHDYYDERFDVKRAVSEFCETNGVYPMSIGDLFSVAIMKA